MKSLERALILTPQRDYAQTMRAILLKLGGAATRVDVELDPMRAMQLAPQPYGLILIDMSMRGLDGLHLLLLLRNQAPACKFVLVSDDGDEKIRALAYQNGVDLFLERPHDTATFAAALTAIAALLEAPSAEPSPSDEVDGPLVHFTDMIETSCLSGESVLLRVRSLRESGDVFIYRGEVFHAQYPAKAAWRPFTRLPAGTAAWRGFGKRRFSICRSHDRDALRGAFWPPFMKSGGA